MDNPSKGKRATYAIPARIIRNPFDNHPAGICPIQSLALRRVLFAALSVSPLMLVAATTLPAQAARSLTFTFPRLSDGSVIPVGYGDIPNALSTEFSCEDGSRARYWKEDYSDLDGVAYGCSSSSTEIVFKPEPGYSLKLLALDFGAYSSDRNSKP